MKRWMMWILCITMVLGLAACKKAPADAEPTTLGTKLQKDFETEIAASDDINAIAEKLSSAEYNTYDCMVQEFPEGYMPGFSEEVTGFKRCVGICPMIGSIPFVCYIFEADDPEGFKTKLEGIADPRWNICTEAAETVASVSGNYVFFAMCPGEDE